MSIYCYINNSLTILPSSNLVNIHTLDEFKIYIMDRLDINNIYLYCYHNFSSIQLIDLLKTESKINYNYLVTTEEDSNCITFTNLNTLYNIVYNIPKLMKVDEFIKNFYCKSIEIICKNGKLKSDDTFVSGYKYFYKAIY
jgi:hypothetical protein